REGTKMTAKRHTALVSTLVFLGTMALAVPPFAPNTTALVRFSEPAMPAERLLSDLSKRTGVRLECAPEVRDDVVLLDVNQVPLVQVMDRIAEATDARWRRTGTTWRLERPEQIVEEEQKREVHARATVIARHLQAMLGALKNPWNAATLHAAMPRLNHFM